MNEQIEVKSEYTSPKTTFRTKDLNMAAFLWCVDGAKLINLDGEGDRNKSSKTVYFAFELPLTEEGLTQLQIDYANGDTKVEPTGFCKRQNQLRDLLHDIIGTKRSITR